MAISAQKPTESIAALIGNLVEDFEKLVRQELSLLKAQYHEGKEERRVALTTLGVFALFSIVGTFLSVLAVVDFLLSMTDLPTWGCYGLASLLYFGLGASFYKLGHPRKRAQEPERNVPPHVARFSVYSTQEKAR